MIQTLFNLATAEPFDLERAASSLSIRTTVVGTLALVGLVLIGALVRNRSARLKLLVYIMIALTVLGTTFILAATTIYLNVNSSSGGPVHWHADFEIWACGEPVAASVGGEVKDKLKDPTGWLSNKIGTASLHEHDDLRIHLEGVVVEQRDASLGKFFSVIGGLINDNRLVVPTDDGQLILSDGGLCPDGKPGDVQVFVYSVNGQGPSGKPAYSQRKVENPEDYIIAPHSQVPPGDCVIIEFGPTTDRTEHRCLQYTVQDDELNKFEEVR